MEESFKRALRLEYFTVIYNLFEAIASILAGGVANSITLIGFGLDSIYVLTLSDFSLDF
jgi:hypothetical protein